MLVQAPILNFDLGIQNKAAQLQNFELEASDFHVLQAGIVSLVQ